MWKGARIKYECLELQNYLSSSSNLTREDQRLLFSLRCEMNLLKANFWRKINVWCFCIKDCKKVLDNEHLVYCDKDKDIRFERILNGSLIEKIEALKQVKLNEECRKKEPETLWSSS